MLSVFKRQTPPAPKPPSFEDYLDGVKVKDGVNTSKLRFNILKAIPIVVAAFGEFDLTPRLTSTHERFNGRLKNSKHYEHLAVDFGVWVWKEDERYFIPGWHRKMIVERIVKDLGSEFDVVLKSDHIHIEYDPKT